MKDREFHILLSSFVSGNYIDDRLEALESLEHMAERHAVDMGAEVIEVLFQGIDLHLETKLLAKLLRSEETLVEVFLKDQSRLFFLIKMLEDGDFPYEAAECLEIILCTCPVCNEPPSYSRDTEKSLSVETGADHTIEGRQLCRRRLALVKSYEDIPAVVLNFVRRKLARIPSMLLMGDEYLSSLVVLQGVFEYLPFEVSLIRIMLRDNVINQRIFQEIGASESLLYDLNDVVLDRKNPDVGAIKKKIAPFLKKGIRSGDFMFLHRMVCVDVDLLRCCVLRKLIKRACLPDWPPAEGKSLEDESVDRRSCNDGIHRTVCSVEKTARIDWNVERDYRRGLLLLVDKLVAEACVPTKSPLVAMLNKVHHGEFTEIPFDASVSYLLYSVVCYEETSSSKIVPVIFDLSSSSLQKGFCTLMLLLRNEKTHLDAETAKFYLGRVRKWIQCGWVPECIREFVLWKIGQVLARERMLCDAVCKYMDAPLPCRDAVTPLSGHHFPDFQSRESGTKGITDHYTEVMGDSIPDADTPTGAENGFYEI